MIGIELDAHHGHEREFADMQDYGEDGDCKNQILHEFLITFLKSHWILLSGRYAKQYSPNQELYWIITMLNYYGRSDAGTEIPTSSRYFMTPG